ncbi:hypothetical protein [Propionivibrio sp.]|uniref:hypothetical protein n=1 Tax=Propionivibrio sp. TaxID=2212460 RepID=UPI003BF34697
MSIQTMSARLDKLAPATPGHKITGFRVIADGQPRTGRTVWQGKGFRLVAPDSAPQKAES